MSDYTDAYAAGRAAYDRGEPSTANPYTVAAHEGLTRRDIVVDHAEPTPKAAALIRLWLSGWQSGRDATESPRS
ncbi:hypothetical protein [Nocardia sp. NPDC052566]|uniref:hypothetical protein n=1 Tax=Nocardia sp. NPDC052566 TaxID=3364330 RepID=UPI0037C6E0FA